MICPSCQIYLPRYRRIVGKCRCGQQLTPEPPGPPDDYDAVSPQGRFWMKVETAPNGCWLWRYHRNRYGYGRFRLADRIRIAHRVAYEWLKGPIPDDLELDHLCRQPSCVNPDHLEPVTHQTNMIRSGRSGPRLSKTHCGKGHPFDAENTYRSRDGKRRCRACARLVEAQYRSGPPLAVRLQSAASGLAERP